ncbi:MAG: gliding motility-associated C-terminal domain-containing protein, partial [Flavobacteriales bacterium]|nr:gliding motility-associated C-terminal domain-containing protein [Flavobacteriales bacterium]
VRIKGKLSVNIGSGDDDMIGFVFGYQAPNSTLGLNHCEMILFDWKAKEQTDLGYFADEGFSLLQLDTLLDLSSQASSWPIFYPKPNMPPGSKLLGTNYDTLNGWDFGVDYDFILTYLTDRIVIEINGDTIFDVPGCYKKGRFGFYNMSQPGAKYSDFSYELVYDFDFASACQGEGVKFTSLDSACPESINNLNIENWTWNFGDGQQSGMINPIHAYQNPGNYLITLTVEDSNGCIQALNKNIDIFALPQFNLGPDTAICEGSAVNLETDHVGPSYSWSTSCSGATCEVQAAGVYTLEITDDNSCSSVDSVEITVIPLPKFDFVKQGTLCKGLELSVVGEHYESLQWSTMDTASSIEIFDPGLFYVEAYNKGCSFQKEIDILSDCDYYIPNSFTPNGDGLNDAFGPVLSQASNFSFQVYDRWGNIVFESQDLSIQWTGYSGSDYYPQGIYVWELEYTNPVSKKIIHDFGKVTLVP